MVSTTPTGQAKYVQLNMQGCSSNYSCRGRSTHYIFWVCLSCPVYKVNAPFYSHLWPLWFYHIFLHYLINGSIFKVIEHKTCLDFFLHLLSANISHSKKNYTRYYHKCSQGFILYQQISKKNTRISNFMKICPLGAELIHADRQTAWSSSCFLQYCECI